MRRLGMRRRVGRFWLAFAVEHESDHRLAKTLREIAEEVARECGYDWGPVQRLYVEAQALEGTRLVDL